MRREDCPFPRFEESWIGLPDEWLGEHAQRRDQAVESAAKYRSPTLTQFAISLALLEDWNIPGLTGNPEKWDLTKIPLPIISWINDVVLMDFAKAFIVPKANSSPLRDGSAEKEPKTARMTTNENAEDGI